jgi:hypothetical protein
MAQASPHLSEKLEAAQRSDTFISLSKVHEVPAGYLGCAGLNLHAENQRSNNITSCFDVRAQWSGSERQRFRPL